MVYKFWNDRSHGETVRRCELSNFVLNNTNAVKSGCGVSWNSGMQIDIASGTIVIGGSEVTVSAVSKTISNGNSSNQRLDLVLINSSGDISILEGTPSNFPETPVYTEDSFVCICMVYVPTNATTISANEIENIGVISWGIAAQGISRFANSFTSKTSLNVTHSLNDSNPIVQVYDSNGEQITPNKIDVVDANNISITFSSSTSGSYIIHGCQNTTASGTNDLVPDTDNTYDIGSSTKRYQDGYFVNVHTGDLVLQNGWKIVEYDRNKTMIDGVIINNNNGDEIFRVTNDGIFFKGKKLNIGE